jgi:stage V sporulation protein R
MPKFVQNTAPGSHLRDAQQQIEAFAREFGLDFFPTLFEVLDFRQMNEVAAYGGFPVRYPHWRFGMEYEQLAKSAEYGLSRIYEMVINNTPSIAYLLEGNSMVDQKLVMSHVYAHVDFFKNNYTFSSTNQGVDPRTGEPLRKWIDTMANHGSIVRRWANRIGIDKIEEFIDTCLSLENLIDLRKPFYAKGKQQAEKKGDEAYQSERDEAEEVPLLRVDREYMESYINPDAFVAKQKKKLAQEKEKAKKNPESPERDVMGFLIEYAPLERWERDVLSIVREEAYYFLPQMQTKIMNEGWATYWHSRLMTEKVCDASEIIEYADRCAGVLATSPGQLNPYKLGVELYRHVQERWNRGMFGKEWDECDDLAARREWNRRTNQGMEKIFEVRKNYNDVTFIDEFLTEEFVVAQKLYTFGYNEKRDRWEIEGRKFKEVKNKLLFALTNAGQPFIDVVDSNHENRGELLLKHDHQGIDLRMDYAREVLTSLQRVWKRPVELHTIVDGKNTLLRFDGKEHAQRAIK